MKTITITNAYTWYNKGDAGILLGIVNSLKKIYNEDIEINILSFTPEEDRKRYCEDKCIKNVESNVLNPFPFKHSKIGKIVAIIKLIIRMIYLLIMMNVSMKTLAGKDKSFDLMLKSDIIVVCGGGFLGGKKFDSLMHLFQIYANTKCKKPVIMMGNSIEPIKRKLIKFFTEKTLLKVDYIYAREKITYQYLSQFMPKEKYELIPDMAFMLEDVIEKKENINQFRKSHDILFGITVRKWNFPNAVENKEIAMDRYVNSIVKMMESLMQKNKAGFIFIPQVIVEYADDTDVAKKIREKLPEKYKESFLILHDDLSPVEIKTLIGNMDYFIGTRMHSNIFATSMKVPTVAIAYEKKTNGIMETVGLQDYVVEINQITAEKLIEKISKSLKNKKVIQQELEIRIPKLRKEIISKLENVMKNY